MSVSAFTDIPDKVILCKNKDTVDDTASLDVAALGEVKLDELPKATGVVVVDGLCITKRFHDRTARRKQKLD